ncbi:hypothetical protein DFH09DRAFT_939085, partial [Mycena vulgaris]
CRVGCDAIEDDHHSFVTCTQYTEWRTKAAAELHKCTNTKLAEKEIEDTYYLGHIPKFYHLILRSAALPDKLTHTRLAHHLAANWHTASIRLSGRIWGDWQREMAKKTNTRGRRNEAGADVVLA